ncbi:MAG: alpha-E domain-containing protein [Xanthomonadales bacterium]|jgi:uncharacterized alpha-E superfamily protein|nr:alpha-E domain-containing protein [Xanthomonadales bacterium]
MMLSRAAERVYWTGRYLERAENTARIVQQYSQLLLDLPDEVGVHWNELVRIFGATGAFEARPGESDESAVFRFLVSDVKSHSSLAASIRMARDNVRNTRDLLPQESWEAVNELDQFARSNLASAEDGEDRFEVLSECIARCLQIDGVLVGTMSHGAPYQFLLLGQSMERADMTSRIIDVGAAYVRSAPEIVERFDSVLGTNVLKSVSGFQMYRQYCQPQVEGRRVVQFLLRDEQFPRSIACALSRAESACRHLPRGDAALEELRGVLTPLGETLNPELTADDVPRIVDRLQQRLNAVHRAVAETWFLPADGSP